MIEDVIRKLLVLGMCLAGVCLAEYGVYTKPAAEPRGGLFSLLGADQSRIEAYFFRAKDEGLCIVDEGNAQPRYGTLEAAMRREKCTAGVNGGYFGADAARTPIGLLRHAGRTISPMSLKGFTVVGIVYDTGETICLERSARVKTPVHLMREAIQGGPFLVEQGRVVQGLEKTKRSTRTFIATDGAGRWCIGLTSMLTLHELAEWLAEKGTLGNFRVHTALNLDGGSSCAFWYGAKGVNRPGFKSVRNYVGVRPRSAMPGAGADNRRPAK